MRVRLLISCMLLALLVYFHPAEPPYGAPEEPGTSSVVAGTACEPQPAVLLEKASLRLAESDAEVQILRRAVPVTLPWPE